MSTLEQTKTDLENEVAALERQIADTATELEAKRAALADARAAAAGKIAEVQAQIAAEQIEQKAAAFLAVAASLDKGMTVEALGAFRKLASELAFAGRLKQGSYSTRESLIKRMLGETVYRMPFPTWSEMAQAWIVTRKAA
jgi:hypothetical protein